MPMATDRCCKIARLLEEYQPFTTGDVGKQNEALEYRWLGRDGYPETSIRELTEEINRQILKNWYEENGQTPTNYKIKEESKLLRGDDCVDRRELVMTLRQQGMEPEQIASEMTGKSTLNRHLKDHLGLEKQNGSDDPTNWTHEKIKYAREVAQGNVEDALEALDQAEILPGGEQADVSVAIHVECPECGSESRLRRVQSRGGICSQCELSETEYGDQAPSRSATATD